MAIFKTRGRAAYIAPGDTTPIFDHIAVWAANTEQTAKFLTEVIGWKRHPTVIRVDDAEKTTGGMIGTFFDAPGLWIELIEPTTPGPGQDILDELGDGALVEINFDLGNEYEKALQDLSVRGVEMLSMDGSPLRDGGVIDEGVFEGGEIQNAGQRIAYFPNELTRGTTVEYYEVLSHDKGSLIYERDHVWKDETRTPGTPRIDYIGILTDSLEETAAFYSGYMGLEVQAKTLTEAGDEVLFINANGCDEQPVWLKLVKPRPGSANAAKLAERGNGFLFEMGVEVKDLEGFNDKASSYGLTLTLGCSGNGDKDAFFAAADARGLPLRIFERGAAENSVTVQRDTA
jgi:catechol 2,3-dioxygenase-like lactoylglutathione lyase family enzyme